ncbi:MAG TPA: hypothetical protein VIY27_02555 [Myxococcota bacterium]
MTYRGMYGLGAEDATPAEAARQAGLRSVRAVLGVAQSALDAAVVRELCYLHDQPGCGRFGVNEDHGNDKAAQERRATVTPLTAVSERAARFLVDDGDASADVPLVRTKLKACDVLHAQVEAKFREFKGVPYHDPVRRNNIRGVIISTGRRLVTCLGALRARSATGKALIRAAIERSLASSRARQACYSTRASGCDKSGESEPNHTSKAAEENRYITAPLAALLERPTSALGQAEPGETNVGAAVKWFSIGTVLLLGAVAAERLMRPEPVRRNSHRRKRPRTSRSRRRGKRR